MKIPNRGKGFQVKELLFNRSVYRLHIAVVAPGPIGDAFVGGAESFHRGAKPIPRFILPIAADELRAVIGLEFQGLQIDSAGLQVVGQQPGKQTGVVGGFLLGIGQEHHAAADFAGGKLVPRQPEGLPLRPGMGNIRQVLGIHRNLSKQPPAAFDAGQVFFLLMRFSSFLDQPMVPQHPADRLMGTGQTMLVHQPTSPHKGISFSQGHDPAFEGGRDLVGTGFGDSRQFLQAGQAFLPVAVQPLANSFGGGLEGPGGRLDSLLQGESDQTQPQFKLVSSVLHPYNLFRESKWFTVHRRPFSARFFERKQNAGRVSVFQGPVFLDAILEPQCRRLGVPPALVHKAMTRR